MKTAITIDVEGTLSADHINECRSFESVKLIDKHLREIPGPVSLFVTPAVIKRNTKIVGRWQESDSTVGLHLHPAQLTSEGSDWLTDYTYEEIEYLVARGSEVFEKHLGVKPTCFRAGRWEYSDRLLRALRTHGFEYDTSLRPERPTIAYSQEGICEVPLTVYSNTFLKGLLWHRGQSSVPLHADAFLNNTVLGLGFRMLVRRLINSSIPYIMISYHDYDMLFESFMSQISSTVEHILSRTNPVTVGEELSPSRC